ncbi:MAG: T9SS type A sorting domain-containing protein [Bacteroidia bacterium]
MKNIKQLIVILLLLQQYAKAQSQQYIGFMTGYVFSDLVKTEISMTRAVNAGASLVAFDLEVKSLSTDYNDFLSGNIDWTQFDHLVNHINSLSCDKVAIRIVVGYSNVGGQIPYLEMNNQTPIIGSSDVMLDQWGNPCLSNWNIVSSPSFAKATTTNRIKNVVNIITQRAYSVLGNKLYWISTNTSGAYETEFPITNNASHTAGGYWVNDGGDYSCRFDYHPDNIAQFYPWLETKYCSDINNLNAAYGTSYTSFSSVPVPTVPAATINSSSLSQIYTMFSTVMGRDWYYFNVDQQKNFLLQLKAEIKSISPTINFCIENGATADELSIVRGNLNTPEWNSIADVVKPGFTGRDWFNNRFIGGDIDRTNYTIERQVELSEYDVVNQAGVTDPATAKNLMRDIAIYNYKQGNKCVIFIGDTATSFFTNTLDLITEIKQHLTNNNNGYGSINIVGSYTTSVDNLISNYYSEVANYNNIKPASFDDGINFYLTPPTWCSGTTACADTVDWGTPNNETCGGTTYFYVNTIGAPTEFSTDNITWNPPISGTTNSYSFSVPETQSCVDIWIRPAGCTDPSKVVWGCYLGSGYSCLTTSINSKNRSKLEVTLYPNPTKSEVNILGVSKADLKKVTITDVLGRELIKTSNTTIINVENLAPGNYFIQLNTEQGYSNTLRFFKE